MERVNGKVLVIDDENDILQTARVVLRPQFGNITTESDPRKIPYLLKNHEFDVILLDMNFKPGETGGKEGLEWLEKILDIEPAANVIMITAYGQINLAVEAMKYGAVDFVVKPWDNEKLKATVYSALHLSKSKKEVQRLKSRQEKLNQVISDKGTMVFGESRAIKQVFNTVEKVAETDADILITGENGTGKELVAREIHNHSTRKNEVFVKVDLGAIPENLFESELFGHKKGAFTDAKEDRAGRFEIASGGTLFLDEIGNLSLTMQAKLLSVLQNRELRRVGSNEIIPIDFRLICATNMNLNEMVLENTFREDLLFRLNTVEITMPPLRERKEDIPVLLDYFMRQYRQKYRKNDLKLAKETIHYLQEYTWPGNVRELQHAVERAVIMSEDSTLKKADFILSKLEKTPQSGESLNLDVMEEKAIRDAIKKHNGNMSKAAKDLGLGRTTLYRKIQKYGI